MMFKKSISIFISLTIIISCLGLGGEFSHARYPAIKVSSSSGHNIEELLEVLKNQNHIIAHQNKIIENQNKIIENQNKILNQGPGGNNTQKETSLLTTIFKYTLLIAGTILVTLLLMSFWNRYNVPRVNVVNQGLLQQPQGGNPGNPGGNLPPANLGEDNKNASAEEKKDDKPKQDDKPKNEEDDNSDDDNDPPGDPKPRHKPYDSLYKYTKQKLSDSSDITIPQTQVEAIGSLQAGGTASQQQEENKDSVSNLETKVDQDEKSPVLTREMISKLPHMERMALVNKITSAYFLKK